MTTRKGAFEVTKLLIFNGADLNAKTDYGDRGRAESEMTPLHFAIRHGRVDIVKLLIDKDKNVVTAVAKRQDGRIYTAMDFLGGAGLKAHKNIAPILQELGVECNALKDYPGYEPVRYMGSLRSVSFCVTYGPPEPKPKPKADYTGLYANAGFVLASRFAPSWVDTSTFAFNEGSQFITGQSLSIPLDDFTFAATRVQVNDLTDYEFAVKWEMEF